MFEIAGFEIDMGAMVADDDEPTRTLSELGTFEIRAYIDDLDQELTGSPKIAPTEPKDPGTGSGGTGGPTKGPYCHAGSWTQ